MNHSPYLALRGGLHHLSEHGSVSPGSRLCWLPSRGQLSRPPSFRLPCYLVSHAFSLTLILCDYTILYSYGVHYRRGPPELGLSDLTRGCS